MNKRKPRINSRSIFCTLFMCKGRLSAYFILLSLFIIFWTINYNSEETVFSKMFMSVKRVNMYKNVSISLTKAKSQAWFTVPNGLEDDWSVSVYDAFYDSRINKTVIFMASQMSDMVEKHGKYLYDFFCIYFNSKGNYLGTVAGNFYTSYMLYCNNSLNGTIPSYVTLMRNDSTSLSDWLLPVRLQTMSELLPQKFALCVGIIFGNQPWLTLIQFIEFHRLQGVEKFYMFYHDLRNPTTRLIFSYYMQNWPELIELIEWAPKTNFCVHYWCQMLRDNYCLYANINKYKYLGFVDIDELLYSVNENITVLQLLQNTDRPYIGSFTFRLKWYQTLRDMSPFWDRLHVQEIKKTVEKYLPLVHYNNVSTLNTELYSPKTVVKPERVLRKWIHFVREHVPGSSYFFMNETQAHLIHFKIRNWWGVFAEQADAVANFSIVDPYQSFSVKLINDLIARVVKAAENIKLL